MQAVQGARHDLEASREWSYPVRHGLPDSASGKRKRPDVSRALLGRLSKCGRPRITLGRRSVVRDTGFCSPQCTVTDTFLVTIALGAFIVTSRTPSW